MRERGVGRVPCELFLDDGALPGDMHVQLPVSGAVRATQPAAAECASEPPAEPAAKPAAKPAAEPATAPASLVRAWLLLLANRRWRLPVGLLQLGVLV